MCDKKRRKLIVDLRRHTMKVLADDEQRYKSVFIVFEFKECQIFCTPAVLSGGVVGNV